MVVWVIIRAVKRQVVHLLDNLGLEGRHYIHKYFVCWGEIFLVLNWASTCMNQSRGSDGLYILYGSNLRITAWIDVVGS